MPSLKLHCVLSVTAVPALTGACSLHSARTTVIPCTRFVMGGEVPPGVATSANQESVLGEEVLQTNKEEGRAQPHSSQDDQQHPLDDGCNTTQAGRAGRQWQQFSKSRRSSHTPEVVALVGPVLSTDSRVAVQACGAAEPACFHGQSWNAALCAARTHAAMPRQPGTTLRSLPAAQPGTPRSPPTEVSIAAVSESGVPRMLPRS